MQAVRERQDAEKVLEREIERQAVDVNLLTNAIKAVNAAGKKSEEGQKLLVQGKAKLEQRLVAKQKEERTVKAMKALNTEIAKSNVGPASLEKLENAIDEAKKAEVLNVLINEGTKKLNQARKTQKQGHKKTTNGKQEGKENEVPDAIEETNKLDTPLTVQYSGYFKFKKTKLELPPDLNGEEFQRLKRFIKLVRQGQPAILACKAEAKGGSHHCKKYKGKDYGNNAWEFYLSEGRAMRAIFDLTGTTCKIMHAGKHPNEKK